MRQLTLYQRLKHLKQFFDIKVLIMQSNPQSLIQNYYRSNQWAYRLFHNRSGFMHMAISEEAYVQKQDFLKQIQVVEMHIIPSTSTVLELGSGQGINSHYLASKYPNILFKMVDLSTEPKQPLRNMKFSYANFEDLRHIRSNSIDIVFAIETICHAHNKLAVLKEIHRVLTPAGKAIVYDGYYNSNPAKLTKTNYAASQLVEYGMAIEEFATIRSFARMIRQSGLELVSTHNLSSQVLPTMTRLEKLATSFLGRGIITKLAIRWLPDLLTRNAITGYLMATLVRSNIALYFEHIVTKPYKKRSASARRKTS
jgi:arsenite methyltransferase